jgi:hypothetical protein
MKNLGRPAIGRPVNRGKTLVQHDILYLSANKLRLFDFPRFSPKNVKRPNGTGKMAVAHGWKMLLAYYPIRH